MFRHFWLLAIIVTTLNGAVWWYRAQARIASNPELAPGYRHLIQGWLLFGNLPWVVMGLGIVFGGVPTVFHFFNPRFGPWVVLWYVTIVMLWIATAVWVLFRRGAEALCVYPGLFNAQIQNPQFVKVILLIGLAGGVAGLLAMIFGDIQPPSNP